MFVYYGILLGYLFGHLWTLKYEDFGKVYFTSLWIECAKLQLHYNIYCLINFFTFTYWLISLTVNMRKAKQYPFTCDNNSKYISKSMSTISCSLSRFPIFGVEQYCYRIILNIHLLQHKITII